MLAHEDFQRLARRPRDFIVVAPLGEDPPPRREKQGVVALVMAGLMVALGTQVLDVVQAVAPGSSRPRRPTGLDTHPRPVLPSTSTWWWSSEPVSDSGRPSPRAGSRIRSPSSSSDLSRLLGDTTLLLGILIGTMCLTELITNNAAAVLMFPVATAAAAQAGLDPRGFAIAVALGASASFLSPIGYQTNTMVYAMGGYRFTDFTRLGLPLTVLVVVVAGLVLPIAWPLR